MKELLEQQILPNVRKPARYIGNELNSIHKDWAKIDFKVALSYPDLYEIGMSNIGLQILYHILNDQPDVLAERVYAPMPDMEEELKKHNLPLFSLESFKPLADFDLIGFGLGHELTYTNIITMLKLANMPICAKQRGEKDPLIMAGGPCTFNPEPVADFFDFFVIGEAEEVILEIVSALRTQHLAHSTSHLISRTEKLEKLSKIKGVYVPSLHNKVEKRIVKDLDNAPYPVKPIIPFVEAVHDRAVVEIMRGCPWGCKFCQAGWTSRPVRQKSPENVAALADQLVKNTGYEEVSLVSLSSSDYKGIDGLAKNLAQKYAKKKVNVALPSLRTNTFSINLAREISRVRPTGLTVAPEAGTQRLRDVIGKKMSEEDIINGVTAAFQGGIESIKLYFMIGLPTETDEDLRGIADLAQKIFEVGRQYTKRLKITANLATFIPKPHTPLQWEEQIGISEAIRRQNIVKDSIRNRKVQVRWHKAESSFLEGVFSRGDRELSKVIIKAWELGARLDAWYEHLNFELWEKAFTETGIDPNQYLKTRSKEAKFPWDFISI